MTRLATRRYRNLAGLALATVAVLLMASIWRTALGDPSVATGALLLILVVILAAYNVRKRLPFLPLGNSSAWLQLHIYAGLFSGVLFVEHVGWRWPAGTLETALALIYLVVFFSGVSGLLLSRGLARRLATRGSEVLFAQIAPRRRAYQAEAERLVTDCLAKMESDAVPEFYCRRLAEYFAAPRHFFRHLLQSQRPRRRLLAEIDSYHRYLNDAERNFMRQIAALVEAKDDLDYQFSLQATLKIWLFVHVPATYALLCAAAVHVLAVLAYRGVIR